MSDSTWRDTAAPIIRAVLAEHAGEPEAAIRKALREAYPWYERKYHPYKIWLSEIAIQRGRKPKLGTFGPKAKERANDPRQGGLFA
jgi:hypothetical protein